MTITLILAAGALARSASDTGWATDQGLPAQGLSRPAADTAGAADAVSLTRSPPAADMAGGSDQVTIDRAFVALEQVVASDGAGINNLAPAGLARTINLTVGYLPSPFTTPQDLAQLADATALALLALRSTADTAAGSDSALAVLGGTGLGLMPLGTGPLGGS